MYRPGRGYPLGMSDAPADAPADAPEAPSEEAAVRKANAAFYDAFEALDLRAMASCWAKREADVCTHPGWETMYGWQEIRESYRAIFANTGFMRFEATDLRVEILGDLARVSCVERIFSVADTHTTHGAVAATNLFLRTDAGWKLTLHHGSPIAATHQVTELSDDAVVN